ncbi:MAG: hypothetical protein KDI63_10920 [Gammaproteobacteria bacterium]|nr:hypothetical protein [Gammaproteobacteria bacterium]
MGLLPREVRRFTNYLPSNSGQRSLILDLHDPADRIYTALAYLVPANPRQAYNRRVLAESILDGGFLEVPARFAPNLGAFFNV